MGEVRGRGGREISCLHLHAKTHTDANATAQACINTHAHTPTFIVHKRTPTLLPYQRVRQYRPTCSASYHCGPGTALQGLRLWSRWASQGEEVEFARNCGSKAKLHSQTAEMKDDWASWMFFFFSFFFSVHRSLSPSAI